MNKAIRNALKLCGVPSHLKGYECLVYAIELTVSDDDYIWNLTKRLYPDVAKKFKSSWQGVERAMRVATVHAFDNMPYDVKKQIFGNTIDYDTGVVPLGQFIAALSEYVKY